MGSRAAAGALGPRIAARRLVSAGADLSTASGDFSRDTAAAALPIAVGAGQTLGMAIVVVVVVVRASPFGCHSAGCLPASSAVALTTTSSRAGRRRCHCSRWIFCGNFAAAAAWQQVFAVWVRSGGYCLRLYLVSYVTRRLSCLRSLLVPDCCGAAFYWPLIAAI